MVTNNNIHGFPYVPEDVLRLRDLLKETHKPGLALLRASGIPLNAGDGDDDAGSGEGAGSGSGGEGGSGAGSGSGSGSGGSGDGDSGDGDGDNGSGSGSGSGSGDGDDGKPQAGMSQVPASELQRLRRIAREKDEADKKRQKELEDEAKKKKREEGRWQELLSEEQEKTKAETERADKAENELKTYKSRILVEKVAKRLGFKDPADAHLYIESEDQEDEGLAESALKKVAKDKKYLVEQKKASGGSGPHNGAGGLTMEDVKNMSQDQINARWDEVQKVMAASSNN